MNFFKKNSTYFCLEQQQQQILFANTVHNIWDTQYLRTSLR